MRISGMQATCCAAFWQINSSPQRKRHWVGWTWPVSMYTSGLCVLTEASRRWEGNTLSLFPAIQVEESESYVQFRIQLHFDQKRPCVTLVWNVLFGNERVSSSVRCRGRQGIFTTALQVSGAKISRETLLLYKTPSCCSKNNSVQMASFIDRYTVREA